MFLIQVNYILFQKNHIPYNFNLKCSDQVIISSIRISNSKLTHIYLLKGEKQPECTFSDCDCDLTQYHIFWNVPTRFPRGIYFFETYSLRKTFLQRLISIIICNFSMSVIFTPNFNFVFTL